MTFSITGSQKFIADFVVSTKTKLEDRSQKKDNVFAQQKQSVPKGYKGEC